MVHGPGRRGGNRRPRLALGPDDADLRLDRLKLGGVRLDVGYGRRDLWCGRRNVRIDGRHGRGHRNLWLRP
jgi:hypothetical protein